MHNLSVFLLTSPPQPSQGGSSRSPYASFSGFPPFLAAEDPLEAFPHLQCHPPFVPLPSLLQLQVWLRSFLNSENKNVVVWAAGHCKTEAPALLWSLTPNHHVFPTAAFRFIAVGMNPSPSVGTGRVAPSLSSTAVQKPPYIWPAVV